MLNRRRVRVLGLAVATLGLAGFAATQLLSSPRHQINPAGFERMQAVMTREEVESILGALPGTMPRGLSFRLMAAAIPMH
jgi:hypothetical protein